MALPALRGRASITLGERGLKPRATPPHQSTSRRGFSSNLSLAEDDSDRAAAAGQGGGGVRA
eukprot:8657876-Pyramimonas_sp.AAC.1